MTPAPMQQQQQMIQPQTDANTRLGVVEVKLGALAEMVEGLVKKLDAKSSINWQPVSITLSVLGMIGAMFFFWINSNNARFEAALLAVNTRIEAIVVKFDGRTDQLATRAEVDKRFEAGAQRRDDLQNLTNARIERVERDLDRVAASVVPRGEHKEQWDGQRDRDSDLRRQIEELRKGQVDLNTPRDTIQRILQRLDALDRVPPRRE